MEAHKVIKKPALTFSFFNVRSRETRHWTRFITPMVYNTIWISWSIIVIGLISYLSTVMSRTSLKAQLVTNDLINQLGQASASWESTHDLTQIPLSEIFPNVKQLFKLSKLITKQTNACFVTWAVLAALLAFVSHRFFLRTESLRGALPPPPPLPPSRRCLRIVEVTDEMVFTSSFISSLLSTSYGW